METALISVIVPVYNTEKYIRECLDSILVQSLGNFELILIDDGSTDGSGKICDEYADKDSRIKVIHKENGGRSSARNRGLDEATGHYICFIDSDDTVKITFLERLFRRIIKCNAELAICDFDAARLTPASKTYDAFGVMSSDDCRQWLYDHYSRENVLMVATCNKMYKKEIFRDLRYPEGKIHEDEFVIGPILNRIQTAIFINEKLYNYRDNDAGITGRDNRMDIRHLDVIDAYRERIAQAVDEGADDFAVITLKNALNKCARFYKDCKKNEERAGMKAALKKYGEVYGRFGFLLNIKQQLKYRLFLVVPKLFVKHFNP